MNMANELKVSIAMTTYNGQRFLEEQLTTLINQSRPADEVIISDDGSTDSTVAILNAFIACNHLENHWHVHINSENKGYARNFLDTALMTTGDLVFFCDQDDIWDPKKLETMTKVMEEDETIDLLCSDLEVLYHEEGGRKWDKKDIQEMTNNGELVQPEFQSNNFFVGRSGCTMCVRKEFLSSAQSVWRKGWAHDDFVWKLTTLKGSCRILHYALIKRRMHANNTSSIKFRSRNWRIAQIRDFQEQYQAFSQYACEQKQEVKKLAIINKNIKCLEYRLKVLENKSIISWFILLARYRECFPQLKTLILDIYLAIIGQYRGNA